MTSRPDEVLRPSDLRVGDPVAFVEDCDPGRAPDDPLYEPVVPAGKTGRVVNVGPDHVRVLLDDLEFWGEPILLWQEGRFPEVVGNGLRCLRRG